MAKKTMAEEQKIALQSVCERCWAVVPDKLQSLSTIMALDLEDIPLESPPVGEICSDGTGIIRIYGMIEPRPSLFSEIFGGVAISDLAANFVNYLNDENVKRIVLEVDSPGGLIDGVQNLSEQILSARGIKPITAFVQSWACSAAYWIASAADKVIISSKTDGVGSIGVVAIHRDMSEKEKQEGIKTTEIIAGKYKRAASQYQPLSPDGQKSLQERVDYLYGIFVYQVARNRGVTVDKVLETMADGRIFIGQQAIDAGLVDGIGTMDLGSLSIQGPSKFMEGANMAGTIKAVTPEEQQQEIDRLKKENEDLRKENDELKKKMPMMNKEAEKQGACDERARMLALDEIALPGFEAIVTSAKRDGKTAQETALTLLKAQKERGISMSAIKADSQTVPGMPQAADSGDDETIRKQMAAAIVGAGKKAK